MSTFLIYFSPTGGTKKVADLLLSEIKVDREIDLSITDTDYEMDSFAPEDICLIAVPSFGGRVPSIALEHLRKMKADKTITVLAAVYGNRAYEDTLLELKNEVLDCGFHVVAAVSAIAEHSIMHLYGEGRPDEEDKKELHEFALQLKKLTDTTLVFQEVLVPGNEPYKDYNGVPMKPKAGNTCMGCGECASKCPVKAIPKENPAYTDENLCITCMRCVYICPEKARILNRDMVLATVQRLKEACESRKENEIFMGEEQ